MMVERVDKRETMKGGGGGDGRVLDVSYVWGRKRRRRSKGR
jgi:hypothetical protein